MTTRSMAHHFAGTTTASHTNSMSRGTRFRTWPWLPHWLHQLADIGLQCLVAVLAVLMIIIIGKQRQLLGSPDQHRPFQRHAGKSPRRIAISKMIGCSGQCFSDLTGGDMQLRAGPLRPHWFWPTSWHPVALDVLFGCREC